MSDLKTLDDLVKLIEDMAEKMQAQINTNKEIQVNAIKLACHFGERTELIRQMDKIEKMKKDINEEQYENDKD